MSLQWTSKKIIKMPPLSDQFWIHVSSEGIAKLIPQIYLYKVIPLQNWSSLHWLHAAANYEEKWSSVILDFTAETWNRVEGEKNSKKAITKLQVSLDHASDPLWWADANDQMSPSWASHSPCPTARGSRDSKGQKLWKFVDSKMGELSEGEIESGEEKKKGDANVIIPLSPLHTCPDQQLPWKVATTISTAWLLLSMMSNGVEFSFGQLGSVASAVLPLSLLLPGGRGQSEKQERPWHCAHTTQQTPCCIYQPCFGHRPPTQPQNCSYKKINVIPARPSRPSKLQAVLQWNCNSTISTSCRTAGCYSVC